MPLLLRIDNVDRLPDGGPVSFELDRRGIDIGRDPYLDWTLPDPDRFISGKHCELRYRDGSYWLHDVSTNGTTINGREGRLTEPYRLQDGDRINVGHYIIAVELEGEDAAPPAPEVARPYAGNVWADVPDAAAAVDRRDFAARARAGSDQGPHGPAELPEEDIGWSIGELTLGAPEPDDPWNAPPAGREAREAWGWDPPAPADSGDPSPPRRTLAAERGAVATQPDAGLRSTPPPHGTAPERRTEVGAQRESAKVGARPGSPDPFGAPDIDSSENASDVAPDTAAEPDRAGPGEAAMPDDPFSAGPTPQGGTPAPAALEAAALRPEPSRTPPTGLAGQWAGGAQQPGTPTAAPIDARPSTSCGGFVAAFERGAGLPSGVVANGTDDAFAEELGALFRLVAQHLQAMLLARAETKSAMRSADRTMIGALENNPLKFSPTPEDALRIMFGAKGRSYLDARATIEASFGDLQRHQLQTFGAMQGALQALFDDLDPKAIEAATPEEGGLAGIVGSRRARLWDSYVERYRAKSGRHERGMIDAFMLLFAEMYDRQR